MIALARPAGAAGGGAGPWAAKESNPVEHRRLVLANGDVRISYVVAGAASPLYRNATGDEIVFGTASGKTEVAFDAPLVFAGYGLVVPNSQDFGYDSYQGLDVKDKIVVVLRYFPEDADQKTRAIVSRYADLRYKAQAARQRGAKGMIVITGPRSPNAGELVPMSFDTAIAGSGLVAVSMLNTTMPMMTRMP